MDRRLEESVRRRGGRPERRSGQFRSVRRAQNTGEGQRLHARERSAERHDVAVQRVPARRSAGEDRGRHWGADQDFGVHG